MNRILIYIDLIPYGEYDIFQATNPTKMNELIPLIYGGVCPNFGNRLWFQGIISEITTEDNLIEYWDASKSVDEINSRYDMVIAPMANVFSIGFKSLLEKLAQTFEKIKIPIYVIACGVQADSYDDLEEICEVIREPATKFIRTVYNSGGEFALRGYFTKEFFNRLGFHSAVVTGCPSLYQLGRNLSVSSSYVEFCDFSPILNGKLKECIPYLEEYPNSQFFDQHTYFELLYGTNYQKSYSKSDVMMLIRKYSLREVQMLAKNRAKLFPDMASWRNYIQKEGFQFSFGSRIHGNIMPILAGIPAVVYACDARTREMAEFFDIPMVMPGRENKIIDLYQLYQTVDYSKFNRKFGERFDDFEKFLQKHGIVKQVNIDNIFFKNEEVVKFNSSDLSYINKILRHHRFSFTIFDFILQTSRKIRGLA